MKKYIYIGLLLTISIIFSINLYCQTKDIWYGLSGGNVFVRNFIYDISKTYILGSTPKGIVRSSDEGISWSFSTSGIGQIDVYTLTLGSDGNIYALANGINSINKYSEMIFKSNNSGKSWTKIYEFSVGSNISAKCYNLYTNPNNGNLYICASGAILFSDDFGITWQKPSNTGLQIWPTCIGFLSSGDILVGATMCSSVMYRSSDNGKSWTSTSQKMCEIYQIYSDTINNYIYAPSRDGLYKSNDDGYTWTNINNSDGFRSVIVNTLGYIYIGVYSTSNGNIMLRSKDNGVTWEKYQTGLGSWYMLYPTLFLTQETYLLTSTTYYSDHGGWDGIYRTDDPTVMKISVDSPLGNTVWGVGSTQTINWSSIGIKGYVNIKLSIDGGSTYPITLASQSTNDGGEAIIIPNNPTYQAKIKVESVSNPDVFGTNPENFTIITPKITVTAPVANANLQPKSQQIISWTSQGVDNIKLELSVDNGVNWEIINSSIKATIGSYNWTVLDKLSSQSIIRIRDLNTSGTIGLSKVFNIQGIILKTPNGGEKLLIGSKYDITWKSIGINNSKIQYSSDNGANWQTIIPSTPANVQSYSWIIPNSASNQCLIRISDDTNSNLIDQSDNVFFITLDKPNLVTPANNSLNQPISFLFKWNKVISATKYKLEVSTDNSFSSNLILNQANITDTFQYILGLSYKMQYFWRVIASNTNGTGDFSNIYNFTTFSLPSIPTPKEPSDNAVNQQVNNLTISWNQSTDVTGYHIQISKDINFVIGLFYDDSTLINTSVVINGLANKTDYFWRVRAKNIAGNSQFSNIYRFTTIVSIPSIPILNSPPNLSLNQDINNVKLSWNKSIDGASYQLQVSTNIDFISGIIFNESTITDTMQLISGLSNKTKYFWRVCAINTAGKSQYSNIYNFTTIVSKPLPPDLQLPKDGALNQQINNMTFSWNQSVDALTYNLQISSDLNFQKNIFYDDTTLTNKSVVINGLANKTDYYWRVRAKNIAGVSQFSKIFSFTTIVEIPSIPKLVEPNNGAQSQNINNLKLTWNIANDATTYQVQLSTDVNFINLLYNNKIQANSCIINELMSNTKYYWRVSAINDAGTSEFSEIYYFTTANSTGIDKLNSVGKILFFPNPANNYINLIGIESDMTKILISSIDGKVQKQFLYNGIKQLDISDIDSGIYFLIISNSKSSVHNKIIIYH